MNKRILKKKLNYLLKYTSYLLKLARWQLKHRLLPLLKKGYKSYRHSKHRVAIALLLVTIILVPIMILRLQNAKKSEAAWYSTIYNYRIPITITNSSGSAKTDYDVLLTIDTSTLIAASQMQADCDDIRVTDNDGTTTITYDLESGCNTTTTKVWARVPEIGTSGKTIYLYYGNPVATNSETNYSGNYLMLSAGSCQTGWTAVSALDNTFLYGSSSYGTTGGDTTSSHTQASCTSGGPSGTEPNSSETGATLSTSNHTHSLRRNITDNTSVLPPYLDMVVCSNSAFSTVLSGQIALFDTTTPSGWTRTTALDSSFPRAAASYGGTGGATTHTHSSSSGGSTAGATSTETGGGTGGVASHTHSTGGSVGDGTHTPPYLDMVFASKDSDGDLLGGMIVIFDSTPGLGWTRFTALDSKFPRGASTYGGTGGSATHTHTVSITANSSSSQSTSDGKGNSVSTSPHSHTGCNATSSADSNLPPYTEVIYAKRIDNSADSVTVTNGTATSAPELAAWWKFDEGADNTCSGGVNDVCDSSTNGIDGANSGATWKNKDFCLSGSCLYFDGTDDVVTITNQDEIDFDIGLNSGFTFSLWARPNSDGEGDTGQILQKGTSTYIRTTNEGSDGLADLEVSLDLATTDATVTITNGVALDRWNHIAISYADDADDEISVYINGQLRGTSTNGVGSLASDANNLLIGGTTTANFHGFIEDVRILDVEKSATEVKYLYDIYATARDNAASFGPDTSYLTDGLTGYWPMDETAADSCTGGANDTCDESGNGFDLAWAGNATTTTGKYGSGTTYDGTGDSAACTDANCGGTNNLDFGAGDQFSFGGWFSNTSTSTDIYFGKKNSLAAGTAGYIMQQTTSDTVRCIVADGTNIVQPVSTDSYNDGLWHHAFCTVGDDYVSLYIDGVLVDQDPNTLTASLDNTDSFVVAESGAGTGDLTGQIDDLRVYRRALSEMDVQNLYNWAPSPVGYWPMDENRDGITLSNTTVATSTTFSHTSDSGSNQLLIVTVSIKNTQNTWYSSSMTYNGDALTLLHRDQRTSDGRATTEIWYLKNPDPGTANVVVTQNVAHAAVYGARTINNVDLVDTFGAYGGTNNTASTSISVTGIAIRRGDWLVDVLQHDGGCSATPTLTYSYQVTDNAYTTNSAAAGGMASHQVGTSATTNTGYSSLNNTAGCSNSLSYAVIQKPTESIFDKSGNGYVGTAASSINWEPGKFGSALDFDGVDGYVDIGTGPISVKSISFWVNPTTTTEYFVNLTSTTDYIWANAGTVTATGFSSPTIYINGVKSTSITAGVWQHITVISDTAENASNLDIGRTADANYLQGKIDDVRLYDYTLSPDQIIQVMNADHPIGGSPIGSQVIRYKLDELNQSTANNSISTHSTLTGAISGATWKHGSDCKIYGCLDFDGTDDVVTTTNANAIDFDTGLSQAVSITAWINADSDGENDVGQIFNKGTNTYCRTDSQGTTDLDLECSLDLGTTDATVNITDGLTTDTWHHIAMIYNDDADDEIEVYIDGILRGTSTNGVGSPATSDTSDLLVGGSSAANFDGSIDEFHLYDLALTKAQVLIDRNANSQASLGGTLGAIERTNVIDGAGANPIGWWKLNENTGTTTVYDSSGSGFNMTLDQVSEDQWWPGKFGSSLWLDGTNDQGYCSEASCGGTTTGLDFDQNTSFTISGWFNTTNAADGVILSKKQTNTAGAVGYMMNTRSTGELRCQTADGVDYANTDSSGVNVLDGTWHHGVCVIDRASGNQYLYLDGVLHSTGTLPPNTLDNTQDFRFGVQGDLGQDMLGQLDELKVFRYALTPAQVAYEYNRGGPVGWWRMDEGTGTTTTYDASGKGYNLTLNGIAEGDWTTGKFGSAISYDGTDDYAYCTDAGCGGTTKLDFGVAPAFSFGAWFKTSTTGTQQRIIGKKSTSAASAGYMADIRTTNAARCKLADGTNDSAISSTATVTDGNWHHIMCVATGSALYMYLDGALVATDSDTSDVTLTLDNTSDFRLGTAGNDSDDLTGQIDDARVYNYALSETQIKEIVGYGAQRFGN